MAKTKFGITLSAETQKRLDFLCTKLGLTKSQAIAYSINTIVLEKYDYIEKGGSDEGK